MASLLCRVVDTPSPTPGSRIRSRYSVIGYINEKMSGVSSLDTTKALLEQAENDFPALLARLENTLNKIEYAPEHWIRRLYTRMILLLRTKTIRLESMFMYRKGRCFANPRTRPRCIVPRRDDHPQ